MPDFGFSGEPSPLDFFADLGGAFTSRFRASSNGIAACAESAAEARSNIRPTRRLCAALGLPEGGLTLGLVISLARLRLHFYCDEAGKARDRYLVVGGMAFRSHRKSELRSEIEEIRQKLGVRPGAEIKWNKLKGHTLRAYMAHADYFESLLRANYIHYHAIIFDRHTLDRVTYPGATDDGVLARMYYQLILHRAARFYGDGCDLHVRPDKANELTHLPRLQNGLNADCFLRYGITNAVRSIKMKDSATDYLAQLNDLATGAIAYHRNERDLAADASIHKQMLALRYLEISRLNNYLSNTSATARNFTIWNFQSKKRNGP